MRRATWWIAGACVVTTAGAARAQTVKEGTPEQHLPAQITQLTGFGERAVWSPDGKRIAFMSKSFGDAFEIDLSTRLMKLLTGHFRHTGFLRVHYLPNGDYLLIGAREFKDIRTTRDRDEEFWIMKSDARSAPVALGQKVSEGVAISRKRLRIAWANTHGQYPDSIAEGESVIHIADVVYDSAGAPRLANVRELLRAKRPECTLEAQDFRKDDTELVYVCYRERDKADVMGLDLASGKITTYRKLAGEYNEVEGVSPDGAWALVESSRDQGADRQDSRHIDLWKLTLAPNSAEFVRMTRWGDWDGYKASNPTVSPDGKWFAFQSARSTDPAGVGYGIFLYRLK
jgi:dipeptidyl aminopeptidase/acylaminoacyl peptidase